MSSDRDGPKQPVINCVVKGRKLTALDKSRKKWTYTAISEYEAQLLCDGVNERGYVYPKFWSCDAANR